MSAGCAFLLPRSEGAQAMQQQDLASQNSLIVKCRLCDLMGSGWELNSSQKGQHGPINSSAVNRKAKRTQLNCSGQSVIILLFLDGHCTASGTSALSCDHPAVFIVI